MPSEEILRRCWDKNPDGAGFMFYKDGIINIEKGFMHWRQFKRALTKHEFGCADDVVMHFRISTSGGKVPGNTHPFPVTTKIEQLKRCKVKTKIALVHNGILGPGEGTLSDTMLFVRDVLASPVVRSNLEDAGIRTLIESRISSSRILVWDKETIWRWGTWEAEGGIYYSNAGYKAPAVSNRLLDCKYNYSYKRGTIYPGYTFRRNWYLPTDTLVCKQCGYVHYVNRFIANTLEAKHLCPVCLHTQQIIGAEATVRELRDADDAWTAVGVPQGAELGGLMEANELECYIKTSGFDEKNPADFHRLDTTTTTLKGPGPWPGDDSWAATAAAMRDKSPAKKENELDEAFMKTMNATDKAFNRVMDSVATRFNNERGIYLVGEA